MKMRLLLAGASALAITWANAAQAENVGIGVLEPQAVLHVSGELGNADDVIFQNMDGYDGAADNENVLLVDEDDGQRVKTIPLTTLLSDTTLSNSSFDFDAGTNILSITEGGNTLTVDLSSLSDTLSSTDTNTVISSVTYNAGVITITDSDGSTFPVDISAIDTVMINSALTYDDATNVLSITEGGSTLTVDLSDLADSFTDTDTTIVSFDYTAATNILSVVDSAFNQFDVDLTELHDQAVNLGNSDLTQTPAGTNRTYDMSGQVLHFDNGHAMIGSVIDPGDSYPTLEGATQLASNYASKGNLSTPWIHTNFLEAFNERDQYTTGIALGQDGKYNGQGDMINFVTSGNSRLRISPAGQLRAYIYGKGSSVLVGNAATDMFLTVDGIGNIREVAAPSDTTIQNTAAALDGSNVLTITDEAGDVTVDLSGLAVTLSDTTVSNTAATLDAGTNVLTITDETGDVTVDLSPVDTDTTDLDWAVANSASDLATGVGDNIYTNGNVGINTNAPSYPLVVDTAATQNALVVREGTENSLTVGRVGIGTDTPGYSLDVSGDIRATGSIYSGDQFLASNFFQTSDRRLKTEIEGFNRGLEVLRQMRTVSYRYNGIGLPANTDRLHYGVIAQELAEIDPELVGSYYSKEDDMEFLTVNVQSMTYVLANALQQLDAENARIVSLLIESEMRMAQMEDRLNRLEAALGVSDQ